MSEDAAQQPESSEWSNPQALRERLERIEQELEQKQKDLLLAAQIGSHLVEENATLKEEVQSFRMKLDLAIREAATQRSTNATQETKIQDLETKLSMRTNELNLVTSQLNQALAKMQDVEAKLVVAQRRMNQQQDYLDTVETLRRQLEQSAANALMLRQKEAAQESRIRELEDSVAELNAHIRRTEAHLSERVPVDVSKMEELQRENDRLKAEVARKNERVAQFEKDANEMDKTIERLKELNEMNAEAQEEIVFLQKQLEMKDKLLEQARETIKLSAQARSASKSESGGVGQRSMSISRELANMSENSPRSDDLSSPLFSEGSSTPISIDDGFRARQNTPYDSSASEGGSGLSTPITATPVGSLASSYRSELGVLGYDPSAAFLEQQQKLSELNRKLEETANMLAEKSEEQLKLQELNKQLQETASLLQARSEQLNNSSSSSSSDAKIIKKEGYMTKEGAFIKSWKRRFFFMESEALYYASDIKTRFVTRGAIDLRGAKVQEANLTNRPSSFSILTPTRTYYLQCDSEEDKKDWIEVIRARVEQIGQSPRKA